MGDKVGMRTYEITDEDNEMIKMAYDTLAKASVEGNFFHTVGSCLKTSSGNFYTGVNCDCIHGSCAEFIAVGKAVSSGEHDFDTIVSVHPDGPAGLFSPCGNCRQMLMEYSPSVKVILADDDGNIIKTDIGELLPLAWKRLPTGDLMH